MILLDTDICIHILRGNRKIIDKRRQYPDQVAVTFITAAELYYGAEKSANPQKNRILVEQFLLTVTVIHSTNQILQRFGILKASLENKGFPLADADLFVVSSALETGQFLVTGNLKHFSRVENLRLENWLK